MSDEKRQTHARTLDLLARNVAQAYVLGQPRRSCWHLMLRVKGAELQVQGSGRFQLKHWLTEDGCFLLSCLGCLALGQKHLKPGLGPPRGSLATYDLLINHFLL